LYVFLSFLISLIDLACWILCFYWMFKLSRRQDSLLQAITEQTHRIERLSKAEHDLIKEVHPTVGEIKDKMEEVSTTLQQTNESLKDSSR